MLGVSIQQQLRHKDIILTAQVIKVIGSQAENGSGVYKMTTDVQ